MVVMIIVAKRTTARKHVAQNIVVLVVHLTADLRLSLVEALVLARNLDADLADRVAFAHQSMLAPTKVVVRVGRRASVLRRAVMMNAADRKVIVGLKHVARNIAAQKHAVQSIVALVARLPVVQKVVVQKLDHRPVAQKAEAKAVVQNHVAPKLAVKIAVPKVALNALPLAHHRVVQKVAGLKHAAMMNAVRKVAGLVVRRHVAKAQAVVKVDVVRHRLVMMM